MARRIEVDIVGDARAFQHALSGGSGPVGPSEDYLALLSGEIEADEYVRRLKATVDARLARAPEAR